MRRLLLLFLVVVLLAACIGQTPPTRQPLPQVGDLVEEALLCGFLLGDGNGVNIEDVVAGGAADGVLQAGDLLVGLDGTSVSNADDLRSVVADKAVGDEVALDILRDSSSLSLGVVLGANPEDPERPLLGVMIETEFDRVAASDLTGQLEGGPLTRAVAVAGRLYTLDPLTAAWGALDVEAPAGPWAVAAGGVYILEAPDSDDAALRDVVSNDRVVFDAGEWRGSRLLGGLDDQVIVSASRPAEGQVDLFEVALMLVDLETRNARWLWIINDFDLGIPVVTFPSPDGTRILVAGTGQEDQVIRYLVLGSDSTVQIRPAQLTAAENLVAVGWFDDRSVLMRSPEGTLSLLDPTTGTVSPLNVPSTVGAVARAWAVGDGSHLLADTGTSLVRFRQDGANEVRVLADRCEIGLIGDIGWRP